ncbi:MAG: hypothetical protein ACI38Z_05135 [Parafannyhessea sp.]|uniref:hypothetical protein n=1 Tax=Parafannyhessea sp. TaxID=2847324 RepID=UPI003F0E4CC0
MAIEIVDGCTGTAHISSDDLAPLNIGIVGYYGAVFEWGDDLALTMQTANTATLGTGAGMVQGRRFWNSAATSVTIQSGTQGQKRNDILVARYAKASDGTESVSPVVVRGTPTTGTPTDPAVNSGDLKLWRIPLDGVSVGTPVRLTEPLVPLAKLRDALEPIATKDVDVSLNTSVPVYATRFGKVVTFSTAAIIDWPGTYQTFTLATGLPPSKIDCRFPIAIQGQANQGAVVYVDDGGSLVVETKGNSLDKAWCFFSGAYLAQ